MVRCYLSGNPVHDRVIRAFYDGCPEEKALVSLNGYEPSDVAVVFGIRKSKVPISFPRGRVIEEQRKAGLDVLVLETGYLKRGDGPDDYYAAGWNGLNGRADFRNAESPPDRFDALMIHVKQWREHGEHIIVCGQVPWDASVDHLDYKAWRRKTLATLEGHGRRVIYKEHPALEPGPPLHTFLKDAWAVVTLNSNSAVEAAIEGIPVFAFDIGSMAWEIAEHDLEALGNPKTPDRAQWLANLAYAQWTPSELSQGLAWRHLMSRSPAPTLAATN